MIGAIKVKDGLFIGDELASQVSFIKITATFPFDGNSKGFGIRSGQQSDTHCEYSRQADPQPLGTNWSQVPHLPVARLRESSKYFRLILKIILDGKDEVATEIFNFIEDAV